MQRAAAAAAAAVVVAPPPPPTINASAVGLQQTKNGELTQRITFTMSDGSARHVTAKTSIRKHCSQWYVTDKPWGSPNPVADVNTIATLTVAQYEQAFGEYVAAMAQGMQVAGTLAAFNPGDVANQFATTLNVTFHSDSLAGSNILHSFPIGGANTLILNNAEYEIVRNAMSRRKELLGQNTAAAAAGAANALYGARGSARIQAFFTAVGVTLRTVFEELNALAEERRGVDTMSQGLKGLFG